MRVRPRTAVIGAGRLARALLPGLIACGYGPVLVRSARGRSARALARAQRRGGAIATAGPLSEDVRLVVLAVPDDRLAGAARALAAERESWRGRVVLHTAGALGRTPLRSLAGRGAATGVFHPMQVLGSDPRLARARLRGSLARIEGEGRARTWAARLARDLGCRPVAAPGRALYHAAASLAANDVVALLDLAAQALVRAGVPAARARAGLLALAQGALDQARAGGVRAALTGPVARGDARTLARQLTALGRALPAAARAHRALSAHLAEVAAAAGVLDRAGRAAVAGVLHRR